MIVEIPYTPRAAFSPLHNRTQRWACVVAHRRAGKTVACVNELIRAACKDVRTGQLYAYVAPYYAQAKSVAFDYLKEFSRPIPGVKVNEAELRIDYPNGNRVQLFGADNADRMRGLAISGLVADEFGDWKPSVWGYVIRPALADRNGWAIIIGTPKGRNQFCQVFEAAKRQPGDWLALMLKASETGLLPQSEINALRIELSDDAFRQEMECDFDAAIIGAILGREMAQAERDGRINDCEYDPHGAPIEISSDIGYHDTATWWFWQPKPRGFSLIDYDEDTGLDASEWIDRLKAKCEGYKLGIIWLPHDARAKTFQTQHSAVEQFLQAFGKGKVDIVPMSKKLDRINAARVVAGRCEFNRTKCADGIEALKQWAYKWDEDRKEFSKEPDHNWASHPGDGYSYGCQVMRERTMAIPPKQPLDRVQAGANGTIEVPPLDLLWKDSKRREARF